MQRPPMQDRPHSPTLLLVIHKRVVISFQRPSTLAAVHATRQTRCVFFPAAVCARATSATEFKDVYRVVRAAHCQ